MDNDTQKHQVTADVVKAAQENPNGWVYKIEGDFKPEEQIPPEAVVGAWKVDENGNITGEFIPNPNHIPGFEKQLKRREK